MIFWLIASFMIVGASAAIALPLLRGSSHGASAAAYDLEVYRDQLAELDRDRARGLVTDDEAAAAHAEIARRMLAADTRLRQQTGAQSSGGAVGMPIVAGLLAVFVCAGSILLYQQFGSPGAPDMPFAQRTDISLAGGEEQHVMEQIAKLESAAKADPGNVDAWLSLADAYKSVERYDDSVGAYRKALGLGPVSAAINGEFAEVLVMVAQGSVTPEARTIFEAVLTEQPTNPRALYYLAVGDYQAGRTREALDRWAALIASSPADAPWLDVVRAGLTQAAQDLGLDVAEVMPDPLPASGGELPSPTAGQRAEIEAMTPEEREAMIREMVDRLDARLGEDPMDLEGWERLIRARMVLGDGNAAQGSLDKALETFAEAPAARQRLAQLADELGLQGPGDDTEAHQVPDIGSMVERLAARLENDPEDLDGWKMLSRSYTALGEPEKAMAAIENAVKLAPDDPQVLILQARAIRGINGGSDNAESAEVLRRLLQISPDNSEALWFLGNAEAAAGNTGKARELLERFMATVPADSPDREMAKQRLEALGG